MSWHNNDRKSKRPPAFDRSIVSLCNSHATLSVTTCRRPPDPQFQCSLVSEVSMKDVMWLTSEKTTEYWKSTELGLLYHFSIAMWPCTQGTVLIKANSLSSLTFQMCCLCFQGIQASLRHWILRHFGCNHGVLHCYCTVASRPYTSHFSIHFCFSFPYDRQQTYCIVNCFCDITQP